ncbi:hypothetical protein [Chitinophaga silvisoli]|uniref:Uncharacterized protein n=1 Tax=Chitinophaga silvisoli TaxID=2291814 RepID=A0A3E1NWR7_9BACT|nr:hypothetical protein [Chitinophaga silvisoli]RFM32365.1 hypothetical protein DXN04_22005 [Chitinophaga silvisoli]
MRKYFFLTLIIVITGLRSSGQGATGTCACTCLKPLFDYLIASNRLYIKESDHILLSTLINDANAAGYSVSYSGCSILTSNINNYFYALTTATSGSQYKARLGDCAVILTAVNNGTVNFTKLASTDCDNSGKVSFNYGKPIHKKYMVTRSVNAYMVSATSDIFPAVTSFTRYGMDTAATNMRVGFSSNNTGTYQLTTVMAIDSAVNIPDDAIILSATLNLFADPAGFYPATYTNAHVLRSETGYQSVGTLCFSSDPWTYKTDPVLIQVLGGTTSGDVVVADDHFQNFSFDLASGLKNSKRLLDKGILLKNMKTLPTQFTDEYTLYATFCSQRNADATKRPYLDITWTFATDTGIVAQLYIDSCYTCTDVSSGFCYSAITDTSVNPYTYGLTGNWQPYRSFAYYGARKESDPTDSTHIRTDGTFLNYAGFWKMTTDSTWQAQDTAVSRWVWNSESTLFNRKGAEMENKDPLGRYNAAIYGYQDALATAVVQNARFREIGYEGFEDYDYIGSTCDSVCAVPRNFDFSAYKNAFDTTEAHTGRYSLRVNAGSSAGITATVAAADDNTFELGYTTTANTCSTDGSTVLKRIVAGSDALLPSFSPIAGKRMVVSVWVKESGQCDGTSYTGNQVSIVVGRATGNISTVATPSGNIIEGWERYEVVVDVATDATALTVNMQNTGSNTVYFDDLRIHPYNANMKSYVYDAETLRLMAELDENNYAAFYEYDDDGSLIRLKKETERGVMTITESRSALLNDY